MASYEVIMTRDITESACLTIKAKSKEEARQKAFALFLQGKVTFEVDDGNTPDGMGPDYAGLETALLIARLRKGLSEAVEYAKYHQPESFDDAEHEAEHKAQFERWDALLNGATDEAAPGDAPSMKEVLQEAAQAWAHQFDGPPDEDLTVGGADLVDWFSSWRERAKAALVAAESAPGA